MAQAIKKLKVEFRQRLVSLGHRPSRELKLLLRQVERMCVHKKNDVVLGDYFLQGNPWADRPWKEFNYWNGWYALAKLCQPRYILEIGTGFGFSTIALARGAGNALKLLISLDLGNFWKLFAQRGEPDKDNLAYVAEGIRQYKNKKNLNFDYLQFRVNTQPSNRSDNQGIPVECPYWRDSPDLVRLLSMTRFDLIFIDGKHTNDGLYNDLASFFQYGTPHCLLVCDDLQYLEALESFSRFVRDYRKEILDYHIWNFLRANEKYGGTYRRDQGIIMKGRDTH